MMLQPMMPNNSLFPFLLLFASAPLVLSKSYTLLDFGGIEGDDSLSSCQKNGQAFNTSFENMVQGDVLVVPKGTYHTMGGIVGENLDGITISIDGTIVLSKDKKHWPRTGPGEKARVMEFFHFIRPNNLTITSSALPKIGGRGQDAGKDGIGMIDGNGATWWGIPGIGYLEIGENRPRLINIDSGSNVTIERIFFKNPPYWTTSMRVNGLEITDCKIEAWRISHDSHTIIDLSAFNTDGFDVTGNNIWIHDSTVWNQDDSFCVKDSTTNVVIENINASGVGLTIGSIASNVNNITFRNAYMYHTYKGIYMKFRGNGIISNVLYENIVMESPEQYPIWIGPAQQSDSSNPCAAHPCSLCWPNIPGMFLTSLFLCKPFAFCSLLCLFVSLSLCLFLFF
jgi:polygalacturonase